MWHVTVDIPFTRRKRYHIVQDEAGSTIYRARYFSDVLEWLRTNDARVYTVAGPNGQTMLVQPFEP